MTVATSSGAAAAAAAIAQAIKASGAIVKVEPQEFEKILSRVEAPLVVMSAGGFLSSSFQYLTSYKGLFFYTKTKSEIFLPGTVEIVNAKSIWIP